MNKNQRLISSAIATSTLMLLTACGGGGGGGGTASTPPPPASDTFTFNSGSVTHVQNAAAMVAGPTPADTVLVITGCTNSACTDKLTITTAQLTPGTVTVSGTIPLNNMYSQGSQTLAYANGNTGGTVIGSGTLTLTAVGGVGGQVSGSYDYMMCSSASSFADCSFQAVGSFSVKRAY